MGSFGLRRLRAVFVLYLLSVDFTCILVFVFVFLLSFVVVVVLSLRLRLLVRPVVVEVDYLITVLEAIVGLGSRRVRCLALGGPQGTGLEMLQGVGGQVVEVVVREVIVVIVVHRSSIGELRSASPSA